MDIREIKKFINFVSKSGASEVTLELKDLKISVKNEVDKKETVIVQPANATSTTPIVDSSPSQLSITEANTPKSHLESDTEEQNTYKEITSPIVGTFYTKPSPDKPELVAVGDKIGPNTVVCLIEAMKIFNDIEAEISGKIIEVLVENGKPVDYGQPLFLVDPKG